jgi:phage shock protein PspC (stress-responsive transcriptional regulator)
MKKTLTINLGGFIFHIDEDAFNKLELYLSTLRRQFSKTSGGDEIIADVETRMAELFKERNGDTKEVINAIDIEEVISILGKPEEYLHDEDYTTEDNSFSSNKTYSKKIHRDVDNRMIGGVASGLAAYMNISAVWTRLLFVALFFSGFGLFLYIILWIVVPSARSTAEKLQMRGKPVTLSNIENFVRDEAHAVGDSVKSMGQKAREYDRFPTNLVGLIGQFFNGVFEIAKLVLKFLFKAIGFVFLLIAFIALGSLATALFIGVDLNSSHYTINEIFDLFQLVSIDSGIYNALTFGLSLLVLGPLFLIVYYGIRLVFGVDPLNRGVRRGLALLSFIGLIIFISSAFRITKNFKSEAYYANEKKLDLKSSSYRLEVLMDDIYYNFDEDFNNDFWTVSKGQSYFKGIKLDIRKSIKGYTYLETEISSRGRNRQAAQENLKSIDYIVEVDSGQIVVSNYYGIKKAKFFRMQEVDHILYMNVGDTVFLSKSTQGLIYDITNINSYYDWDMSEHYWTMTEQGLLCADCDESADLLEEMEEEQEYKDIESNQDQVKEPSEEVRIENGLIIIEETQASLFLPDLKSKDYSSTSVAILITPNEIQTLI